MNYNKIMKFFDEVGFVSEKEKSMASANDVKEEKQQEKQAEEKQELKPYPVFGNDFEVSQPAFVNFYKYRMKTMVLKYKLVGRVDENGKYVINNLIKRDLVNMEKEIEDQGEEYYKAIALYMKKHFYYTIKIKKQEEGKAVASLYLAEYVDNFLGHEYIVSHVADYIDDYDDDFRVKVRKAFHLVDVKVKVDDFDVPELAVIMQDAFDFELITGSLYDSAAQIFVMSMLKELEEAGPLGQELLAKYRLLLSESDIEINEKFRYTSYKALLDRLMDEYGGYEKMGLDPEKVQRIVLEMNRTLMQIDKAASRGPLEMEAHQNKDKKVLSAGKKSQAKKSAAKKNDGAKADKKKDAKKDKKEEKGPGVTLDSPSSSSSSSSSGLGDFIMDMAGIVLSAATESVVSNIKDVIKDFADTAMRPQNIDAGDRHQNSYQRSESKEEEEWGKIFETSIESGDGSGIEVESGGLGINAEEADELHVEIEMQQF